MLNIDKSSSLVVTLYCGSSAERMHGAAKLSMFSAQLPALGDVRHLECGKESGPIGCFDLQAMNLSS